jgi:hypothetical protein
MTKPHSPARRPFSGVAVRSIAIVALVASGALAGCGAGNDTRTLVIEQGAPALVAYGDDVARGLAFDATLTDPDGNEGVLIGNLLTVDLPDPGSDGELEERIGTLVFTFGDDELVVIGGTSYPAADAEMAAGEPQLRVVVGGTGAYRGARGEVVTTRNADGTYTHLFTLLD